MVFNLSSEIRLLLCSIVVALGACVHVAGDRAVAFASETISHSVSDAHIVDTLFQPQATLVSDPESTISVDFEPEPVSGQFAWVDSNQNLWVGQVDPETGYLTPRDGRGILLDNQAARPGDLEARNGPEWALSDTGPQIVYTKIFAFGTLLARAFFQDGGWTTESLQKGFFRFVPYGSHDPGDPNPRIFYLGPNNPSNPASPKTVYWRDIKQPSSETKIGKVNPIRWIPGSRQLLYTAVPEGAANRDKQVFLLDVDSNTVIQVTDSIGDKESPRVWTGPDFSGQRLMSVVRNQDVLEVYVEHVDPADESRNWELSGELFLPPEAVGPYIHLARPFVHAGSSYVVVLAIECRHPERCNSTFTRPGGLNEIWLLGSLSSEPFWRRISEDIPAYRNDPENLEINGSPFVYIYRKNAADGSPEGTYKLETGL